MRNRTNASPLSEAPKLRREVIDYAPDLWERIEPTWRTLLGKSGESSAFLSAGWIGSWLEAFGAATRPRALVWRDAGDEPVGCALISVGKERVGPLRLRCGYLNATGVSDVSSEHNDVLCLPEYREPIIEDMARAVCSGGYDKLVLTGVRFALADRMRRLWPVDAFEGYLSEAPYIALARLRADRTPYVECLSPTVASQVRRSIRLYRSEFGYERVDVASSGDRALEWFEELVALHEKRWKAKGQTGCFSQASVRRFHEGLLARAPGDGADELVAEVLRVRFGDQTIGMLYTLAYRGRVSFYQSGLRYHEDNRLKPGFVTHAMAAEHYLQAGAEEYDFLGGEPVPVRYKRSLSTDVRMLAWLRLPSPSLKMQTLYALRRLARGFKDRGVHFQHQSSTVRADGWEAPTTHRSPRGAEARDERSRSVESRLAS